MTYDDAIKIKNDVHWEDSANWTLDEDLPIERDLFGVGLRDQKFEKQIAGIFMAP